MRSNVPAEFNNPFRTVSAQARVRDVRPHFSAVTIEGDEGKTSFAAIVKDGQIVRMALEGQSIYVDAWTPDESATHVANWQLIGTLPMAGTADVDLSLAPSTLWVAIDGYVGYTDWTLSGIGSWTSAVNWPGEFLSVAALSDDRAAVCEVYPDTQSGDVAWLCIQTKNSGRRWWSGHLPNITTKARLAAVTVAGTDYLYLDDGHQKRPVLVRHYANGAWSACEPILPMDSTDDDSVLSVGYAGIVDGRPYLTGRLKRKYGPSYGVYLEGPDEFTFGRDMVYGLTDSYGQMLQLGDAIWVASLGVCYHSALPSDVGMDIDLLGLGANFGANGPATLEFELPKSSAARVHPGDEVVLEAVCNDQPVQLGTYGVENVHDGLSTEAGHTYQVACTSWACKRLGEWEADTFIEYDSQSEVHGDPSELTKLIRRSGQWTADAGLRIDSLNVDGVLYTTPPASTGGEITAKFTDMTNDMLVGVGLNYGEETLADAAIRLGKKVDEVKEEERAKYGIFLIRNKDHLQLYHYNSTRVVDGVRWPWFMSSERSFAWMADTTTLWLKARFQDGTMGLLFRVNDTDDWYHGFDYGVFLNRDAFPAQFDYYGRGAIFMRNNTGFRMSYMVPSEADVIPIYTTEEKLAQFGRSLSDRDTGVGQTVQIDEEQIAFTGIRTRTGTPELEVTDGKVILSTLGPGSAISQTANFAYDRTSNYVIVELGTGLPSGNFSSVSVFVKKIGNPQDGVEVRLYRGNGGREGNVHAPLGEHLAAGSIPADEITTTGSAVTAYFYTPIEIDPAERYRLVIARMENPTHPSGASYYAYGVSNQFAGATYVFREDTDEFQPSGNLGFSVISKAAQGDGYAVCAKLDSSVSTDPGYYQNMALVVTSGEGKGNAWKILRHERDDFYGTVTFYIDRSPGYVFGTGSKVKVVSAFYGLTRGLNNTIVTAHADKSQVNWPGPSGKTTAFDYASADPNLTLAEVAQKIARKAGVRDVVIANRFGPLDLGALMATMAGVSQNLVALLTTDAEPATLTLGWLGGGRTLVQLDWWPNNIRVQAVREGDGSYALQTIHNEMSWVGLSAADISHLRVSLFEGRLSVWTAGYLVMTVVIPNTFAQPGFAWDTFGVSGTGSGVVDVLVPEAGSRVDSFTIDMRRKGLDLLSQLIGQKRVFFCDDALGRLRLFTERLLVSGVYDRAIEIAQDWNDAPATRILVEGAESLEVSDAGSLQRRGNLFRGITYNELNNVEDARYYAQLALEDARLAEKRVTVLGAVDPRIEPGDEITLLNDGVEQRVVVDTLALNMVVTETDATFDMQLSGGAE